MQPRCFAFLLLAAACSLHPRAADTNSMPGDLILSNYFKAQTEQLAARSLANITSLEEWKRRRETARRELQEMLGLMPYPERTDLNPVVTGKLDHELFTVEKLHYQSMPGLYVTANLYVPKNLTGKAPAILYVCGHARVMQGNMSYGNKAGYEHHGSWFARNGYVCLTIDTIQLGELQGLHHGTYREAMWWWNSRGYTPAGVEAWNSIRAIDYLQSRAEVDPERIGVTGRSGGGAYSWWTAALDERVKVAAPVAGITDLENHVVDGTVEGHCDCMFTVNTYRWDYAQVAALVAPRPLLICNSDKDYIFPLDGVQRIHRKVAAIYQLYGASTNLGLLITEGPHKDTQDLQLPVFRWFNRFLKKEDPLIEMAAVKLFTPEKLRVFEQLPADERTTRIHETFVPLHSPKALPQSGWDSQFREWKGALREKVFRGWNWREASSPSNVKLLMEEARGERKLAVHEFSSDGIPLRIYQVNPASNPEKEPAKMVVLNPSEWTAWLAAFAEHFPNALKEEIQAAHPMNEAGAAKFPLPATEVFYVAPRGIGLTAWSGNERKQNQILRRFNLIGQTLEGMRVWDIRRAVRAVSILHPASPARIHASATGPMAVNLLYAALFEPQLKQLELTAMPDSHMHGPDYLNVLRFLDIPQALTMVLAEAEVWINSPAGNRWEYVKNAAKAMNREEKLHWNGIEDGKFQDGRLE